MIGRVTVRAKKIDESISKQWVGEIIFQDEKHIKIRGVFNEEINHLRLGIIKPQTISIEYFWLDKGYNIFVFFEPDFSFRNFYCNICSKPQILDNILSFTDFDIDVLVNRNFETEILDMDEFEVNSLKYNYSTSLKIFIQENLTELLNLIQQRSFPFDRFNYSEF